MSFRRLIGRAVWPELGVVSVVGVHQLSSLAHAHADSQLFEASPPQANNAAHVRIENTDTAVFAWGSGTFGETGHGVEKDEALPRPIDALRGKGSSAAQVGRCGVA